MISKRRIKKSILKLTAYGETNNILRQLSQNVSPDAKLEQAVFGVGAHLQKGLRIQTAALNAAMDCAVVQAHKANLFADFRKARLAQLEELYG